MCDLVVVSNNTYYIHMYIFGDNQYSVIHTHIIFTEIRKTSSIDTGACHQHPPPPPPPILFLHWQKV